MLAFMMPIWPDEYACLGNPITVAIPRLGRRFNFTTVSPTEPIQPIQVVEPLIIHADSGIRAMC
jgi:hypothetical protein